MNLNELKSQRMNEKAQILLFKREGILVDSCHSLVDLSSSFGRSVFDQWPVLESIRPILSDIGESMDFFRLPAIEFALDGLNGIYDFEFFPHPEDPELLQLLIMDQTRIYRYFQRIQQERNVLLLEKEYQQTGRNVQISSSID